MWANRMLASSVVLGFVAVLHGVEPHAVDRERWLYLIALPLGYGHLLGGLLFSSNGRAPGVWWGEAAVRRAFLGSLVLTLLAAYTWALQRDVPGLILVLALLFVSAWHIVENDLRLARSYRSGLRLSRAPLTPRERAVAGGAVLGILALSLGTPAGVELSERVLGRSDLPTWTTLPDLASVILLYHAASWVIFFLDRARAGSRARARAIRRRLAALHLAPWVVHLACYLWIDGLFTLLSMPTLYLFWSALHAFQTASARSRATQAA
jgi:hypothetical protein